METLPPEDLMPVIVADLADDEDRNVLDAAASTGGRVWVPLETAPVSAAQHILEVHTPGHAEPGFYIAEPLGPPNDDGFPLRIRPMTGAKKARPEAPAAAEVVRGRRVQSSMNLSESHTRDLSYSGPMPTEEDDAIGRALAGGKLVIEALIGRGGVGTVYKARHRELQMPVAVKVLHESFQADIDFCRRFYAEALAASRLDHPNITRVIDFGQEPDGQLYFAMEFLAGVELRAVLEKDRKLDAKRIAALMMQVCAGLSHAHARGIVHRDIKPENLLLVRSHDDDGRPVEIVKVCDFGIAIQRARPHTPDGVIAGTPEYMSPEQCADQPLDARSDIYACGVVLYELATGQLPFISDQPAELLRKHQVTPPMAPTRIDPSVDPRLEAVIMRALQKDPAGRQQSMRELRAELRDLLGPAHEIGPPSMRMETPMAFPVTRPRLPTLPEDALETEARMSQARKPFTPPEWLEKGAPVMSVAQVEQAADLDSLGANTVAWTTRLAQTNDETTFAQGAQKLEPAVKALAQRGDVDVLWKVSSTMHGIASGQGTAAIRVAAAKLLRLFDDPQLLVQVAEKMLGTPAPESQDKARKLLLHAGVAGAYGLYGARVKLARNPAVRPIFVSGLTEFGPRGWPVVKASLEKIANVPEPNPATVDLAEDLLLCVPAIGDESAGHVVLKFLRSQQSNVCRAAAAALIKLWGQRAKPVFLAMVQAKEDVVRVAGIAGLRQLGAIDEHLVPRLHAILTRRVAAAEEVRAAAAVALAHASGNARQPAVSLLAQLLAPGREPPDPKRTPGVLSRQDAVTLAAARSLVALGGRQFHKLIAERAEHSPEPLRAQLRSLLTS
jgi:serine/threonine-protein kinase